MLRISGVFVVIKWLIKKLVVNFSIHVHFIWICSVQVYTLVEVDNSDRYINSVY
jgi:hypothetical protein